MNVIAIETSSSSGSVACGFEKTVMEEVFTKGMHHGRELIIKIKELLEENEKTLEEINLIVVDVGPGSYTGLRIGVMTAKTLSFCKAIKLYPLSSLDILVQNLVPAARCACTLIDAKQGEVYFCLFEPQDYYWKRISEYQILKPEEALKKIPRGASIIGDGILKIEGLATRADFDIISENDWRISARNALHLTARNFTPDKAIHPFELQPLYLRKSMAEVLWEKKR